jgi:hypothetical protein
MAHEQIYRQFNDGVWIHQFPRMGATDDHHSPAIRARPGSEAQSVNWEALHGRIWQLNSAEVARE